MSSGPRPSPGAANVSPHTPGIVDARHARLMRRAATASVCVAAVLMLVKAVAYAGTHSVAVLGALADSSADLVSSLGILFAVRQALTPADSEHRFGHGKAEPLIGLAQALFIAGSATFVLVEAIRHYLAPEPVANAEAGIGVILFSLVVTFVLVLYQRSVIRQTQSLAISADSLHYVGDLLTNLGVIAALVLSSSFGWWAADPLIGIVIAVVLYFAAWSVLSNSLDQLMDKEFPAEEREKIREIARGHDRVKGVHDIRTRVAGTQSFIQLHLEMDPALKLDEAHAVSDDVERRLRNAFPRTEILIHIDPFGIENPPPLARS
jgi:ferrous-iron efflux pump FieF